MGFAPIYLLNRFVFRLSDFLRHWYINGSRVFASILLSFLERLDHSLALQVSVHYFFRPLYGDYSVIGRILGVIFRTFRIILALVIYAIVLAIALLLYLIWLVIPFAPLFMAFHSLSLQ
jgi:hypothetical protein